ncbi:hypothetical protein GCM10023195_46410 [Actinoallomurus liliacearum]|uniref:Uncharacterized protein n=1 Tax=Actinoallomurus liliacearum TaxID=1080073 RepID=A0ABP8TLE3_9ACTN
MPVVPHREAARTMSADPPSRRRAGAAEETSVVVKENAPDIERFEGTRDPGRAEEPLGGGVRRSARRCRA